MTVAPASSPASPQLRQALVALKQLRARLGELERARTEPIAIIGMGCRFPGAGSPQAFWELLRDGVDAITETPRDRWDAARLYDADPTLPGRLSTRWGGFLEHVEAFDAEFFGISPREADQMDPQQRLLLEVAYETLESAGQVLEHLAGSQTGIFVGVHSHSSDYYLLQREQNRIDAYSGTGSSHSVLAGRLAYLLDLQGPSLAVDSACSSSLVAVHLACQSLRSGESRLAFAGGINLMLEPSFTEAASRMQMLAADGRCKAFDARADGFVRGEGCGMVLLKRLSDAVADGDPLLAVIRGSAVNQDGHTNGLTAPNGLSQQRVLRQALDNAGVAAADVSYVEAHGTGTALGDPIEVEALDAVFGRATDRAQPCAVGSAKTNVGHLEGAAGIAGLIKVVLSLRHATIPPLLHLQRLNPHIDVADARLVFPTEPRPWAAGETPRVAGVSSFGWSGTNAHVVVQEAPAPVAPLTAQVTDGGPQLLPVSARHPAALRALAVAYRELALGPGATHLAELCGPAGTRRTHHTHRLAVVGRSGLELADALDAFLRGDAHPRLAAGRAAGPRAPRLVYVFPGQGGQWPGMARGLLEHEPTFRASLERVALALAPHTGWDLLPRLAAGEPLVDIDAVQPALFAVQVGLAELLATWGLRPDAVVGHSLGEIAAAHVAGRLSLADAALVVAERSRLLKRIAGRGGMALVELDAETTRAALVGREDRLAVAVVNAPRATVVGGDTTALDELLAELKLRDVFVRRVQVDVASHSPQVDRLLPELAAALGALQPQPGRVPFFSTVSGARLSGLTDATYWTRNLRQPVRFWDATRELLAEGATTFLELSPHPVLRLAVEQSIQALGLDTSAVVPTLLRDGDESAHVRVAVAALYCRGHAPAWAALAPTATAGMELPTYPWQRQRYWLPATATTTAATALTAAEPELPARRRLYELAWLPTPRAQSTQLTAPLPLGTGSLPPATSPLPPASNPPPADTGPLTAATGALTAATSLVAAATGPLPAATGLVPPDTGSAPAATGPLTAATGPVPPDTSALPAATGLVPGATWPLPLGTGSLPPATGLLPAATNALPSVTGAVLRGTDPPPGGTWLIVADRQSVAVAVARGLSERGYRPLLVWPAALGELEQRLETCLNDQGDQPPLRGILDLGSLDASVPEEHTPGEVVLSEQVSRSATLLRVVQQLIRTPAADGPSEGRREPREGLREGPRVWVVTRGAQRIGAMIPAPQQASVWGLGRVIANEQPDLWGGLIDLDSTSTDIGLLLDEITGLHRDDSTGPHRDDSTGPHRLEITAQYRDDSVAFRGGQRFVARLVPATLRSRPVADTVVRADATYLISGGLGGLGLVLARWLAANGAHHLALVGRSGPSAAAEAALDALRQSGVQVKVLRGDIADFNTVVAVLDETGRSMPPVRGIFHAAGVLDDATVTRQDAESLRRVMSPKIAGAWNLHVATRDLALDHFVLYSSIAALLGTRGQANYAAANAYLDALAQHRRASGQPALSINWGPWSEVGLAAQGDRSQRLARLGIGALDPAENLAALGILLRSDADQVAAVEADWGQYVGQLPAGRAAFFDQLARVQPEAGDSPSRQLDRLEAAAPPVRLSLLQSLVREQLAAVMRLDPARPIDAGRGFFELGMDSLMAVELRNRLQLALGRGLLSTLAFDYPTLEGLSQYLLHQLWPALDTSQRASSDEAQPDLAAGMDGLSRDEVSALLDEELQLAGERNLL